MLHLAMQNLEAVAVGNLGDVERLLVDGIFRKRCGSCGIVPSHLADKEAAEIALGYILVEGSAIHGLCF